MQLSARSRAGQPPNEGSTLSVLFDPADHSEVSADVL